MPYHGGYAATRRPESSRPDGGPGGPGARAWSPAADRESVGFGQAPVPADKCPAIEELTANKVRRWELRPKDWHAIWTNLIDSPGAPRLKRAKAAHG